ncbi:substrate-binding periplasmic protein [Undibacterium squillarum]|uniref:Solute-binding protein family 3/N-terminal domain-containing protein n=1 Tax=Undibacterium squillarum TaxID=1131567 RepID=A0ABQ2Y3B0_9BURK|nr:transporter substrate-binding domain-containing protein [Undibacterium squillarum]GGX53949.1 hypothetical protein GCM10010946_35770 [Undibacterium squillarum]
MAFPTAALEYQVFTQEMPNGRCAGPMPSDKTSNLLDFISLAEQIQLKRVCVPWPRALKMLEQGEGLIFGISKNKEREKTLHYSQPVVMRYIFVVTRADAQFPAKNLQDLKGKVIGVPRGVQFSDEFEMMRDKVFKLENDHPQPLSRIYKLLFKRMDAALFASPVANPVWIERRLQAIRDQQPVDAGGLDDVKLVASPEPLMADTLHFAIRADKDQGIIDQINHGLMRARKAGILDEPPGK